MSRRNAALVLGLLTASFVGCAAVRPFPLGVGVSNDTPTDFTYLAGRATQTFASPSATVQPAVVHAMDDLRMIGVRQVREGNSLVFEGTTADDRRVIVNLETQPSGATRLRTRIGLFGDEALSRALMDRVGIRLGSLPPTAVPVEPPSTPGTNPFFSRSAVSDEKMLKDRADALGKGQDAP